MITAAAQAPGRQAGCPSTEGERWAADALTTLRAARFAPDAVTGFLAQSLDRAAVTRARRGGLALQARRWSLAGACVALTLREALSLRGRTLRARSPLTWCAIQAAMLDWHLGMVEGVDGDLRSRLSAADALTLGRGGLGAVRRRGAPEHPAVPAAACGGRCQ